MLIVCPSCASEYTIDPAKLGADGRRLKCASCRNIWFCRADGTAGDAHATAASALEAASAGVSSAGGGIRRLVAPAAFCILLGAVGVLASPLISPRLGALGEALALPLTLDEIDPVLSRDGRELVVRGVIGNAGDRSHGIPSLEIAVQSGDEEVLASSTHAPPRPVLGPGETVEFEVQVQSPPADGRQVRVQFTRSGLAVASRFLWDGSL
jgi:predicted Zn finger-like uncharacterized protein